MRRWFWTFTTLVAALGTVVVSAWARSLDHCVSSGQAPDGLVSAWDADDDEMQWTAFEVSASGEITARNAPGVVRVVRLYGVELAEESRNDAVEGVIKPLCTCPVILQEVVPGEDSRVRVLAVVGRRRPICTLDIAGVLVRQGLARYDHAAWARPDVLPRRILTFPGLTPPEEEPSKSQ